MTKGKGNDLQGSSSVKNLLNQYRGLLYPSTSKHFKITNVSLSVLSKIESMIVSVYSYIYL